MWRTCWVNVSLIGNQKEESLVSELRRNHSVCILYVAELLFLSSSFTRVLLLYVLVNISLLNRVDWFLDHPVYSNTATSYFRDSHKLYLFFAKAIRPLCWCFRQDENTDNYVMFELLQPWYRRVKWPYLKRDSVKRWTVRTMQLTLNRYESTSNEIAAVVVVRVPFAVSYCSRFSELPNDTVKSCHVFPSHFPVKQMSDNSF